MQDKLPKTQRRLMKEFPEIKEDVAESIDIKIKAKVLTYRSDNVNKDVSVVLREEIKKCVKTKNIGKISKKCNKLASEYLENNSIWFLQENWYCLLAYFVTLATMFLRVVEVKTEMNDLISFVMYFVAALLWLIIVQTKRLMGLKAAQQKQIFFRDISSPFDIPSINFCFRLFLPASYNIHLLEFRDILKIFLHPPRCSENAARHCNRQSPFEDLSYIFL